AIAGGDNELTDFLQLRFPRLAVLALAQSGIGRGFLARLDRADHERYVGGAQSGAFRKVTRYILATFAKQLRDAGDPESIELVDRPHHGQPLSVIGDADRISHPIEHLAVIHLDHIGAARDAERFHRVGGHHAHFGIRSGRRRTHGVGIELHELAEAAGTRLLVAVDVTDAIAAVGFWQRLEIFRNVARERRGQIVAQRNPLLVVVLQREHALVGPVLVGQEFSQRIGIFERRRLHRLEAVALVDRAYPFQHRTRRRDLGGPAIGEPTRQAGFELLRLFRFLGHEARWYQPGRRAATRFNVAAAPSARAWRRRLLSASTSAAA